MGDLLDVTRRFFEEDGWSPAVYDDEGPVVATAFEGDSGRFPVYASVVEDQDRVVCYSVRPDRVPFESRAAVSELFTLVNFGLLVGNFELDMEDGEARFRTSVDVEGTELSPALLRQVVYANVTTYDHFAPAIDAVVAGDRSAVAAYAETGPA